ncbi:MAG: zinc-ribbon domain [Gaiellales bacterium]|nr:zinc-ribbon domain [Gaiellales bacterium]
MFCHQCGAKRPPDASFCPMCGTWFAGGAAAPGGPSQRLSLTNSFGTAVSSLFTRRAGLALPVVFVTGLVGYVVLAAGAALTILAGFGTLWPRRIVDTSCWVRSDTPTEYTLSRPGNGTQYWRHLPGCDMLRIHPDWTLIVIGATLTILVYAFAVAMAAAINARAAAYVVEPEYRLWPSFRQLLRTTGRIIGWTLALWLGFGLAWGLVAVVAIVLAGLGGIFVLLLVLLILAAIGAGIWFGVPLGVHAWLSFLLMVIDDVPLRQSWNSVAVSTGQAWGFVGMSVVAAIGFSIASQITNLFFKLGTSGIAIGIVLTVAVYMLQTLFYTLYAVIVARGLSNGPLPEAVAVS